jgi:hypothetical protein
MLCGYVSLKQMVKLFFGGEAKQPFKLWIVELNQETS